MAGIHDPHLHLIVDGVPLMPRTVVNRVYTFELPAGVRQVIIASRSVVPRAAGGGSLDPRRLGVPLHRMVLRGPGGPVEIGPNHPGLTDGFHANEESHRWTNGRAVAPPELLIGITGPVTVEVHIGAIDLDYPSDRG